MAGIKITDLPAVAAAELTDVFPVDQTPGPVTYKESNSQLLSLFEANIVITDSNFSGTLSPAHGGTGINNGAFTISLGGSVVTDGAFFLNGAFGTQFNITGATNVTFPTSGTLATTGGIVTSVSGTTNRITSTGGTTPVIDISASYVGQSSITTLGTIGTGVWQGTLVGPTYGGTGINNGSSTFTYGGNTSFVGAFTFAGTLTNNTAVTFPTSGTLATTSQLPTPAALTQANDTNVTLTLGGTPATALLQATSITAGWTGTLSGTRGGTGVNNGASTITIGGSHTLTGAFTSNFTFTNTTAVTFPTSGTLATTAQIPTGAALTAGNDTNVTLTLGGSPTTALVNAASVTAGWTGQLSLARGGTNANLTASNGGIFYSTASAGAILAGTATANQLLLSGSSTTPAWSTSTYPATNAINTLLYASSANTMAALSTANSSVLITSSGGVPSLSTTLPSGISATNMSLTTPALGTPSAGVLSSCTGYPTSALTGLGTGVATWLATPTSANLAAVVATTSTGSGALVFGSSPTIATPYINQINDSNAKAMLVLTTTASAVNNFGIFNGATGIGPVLYATGSDSNVGMTFLTQAAGFYTFESTSSTPLVIASGTGYQHVTQLSFANTSANRTVTFPDSAGTLVVATNIANGTTATLLGSLGPTGSHTTVQTWLQIVDPAGATRYIPCF